VAGEGISLVRHQLDGARDAWLAGDWKAARAGAQNALSGAVAARDAQLHAGASLLLAQVLSLQSSFAWARRFGTRARDLFAGEQQPNGVADAMLCLSYIDSALGHEELAVCAADAAIAGGEGSTRRSAAGLNYRGVAAIWSGEYREARALLATACQLAPQEAGSPSAVFQPQANAVFNEVLRCARMRMEGHRVDLSELQLLLERQWALVKAGTTGSLISTSVDPGLFLLDFASCFLASRCGQDAAADRHYLACLQRAARLPQTSWMQALVLWARLERTLAAGDAEQVASTAAGLVAVADAGEHAPMRAFARRLAAEARRYLDRAPSAHATWFAAPIVEGP
jgi:hypothetical protein